MASYELMSFDRFESISLVGAIEQQSPFTLNVGYWLRDPNHLMLYQSKLQLIHAVIFCGSKPVLKFSLG